MANVGSNLKNGRPGPRRVCGDARRARLRHRAGKSRRPAWLIPLRSVWRVLPLDCAAEHFLGIQELGEVVGNMSTLNRNLESLVEVGRDIERVSDVWLSFHGKVSTR